MLIDTLAAMTLNGLAFYAVAATIDRRGSPLQASRRGCSSRFRPSPCSSRWATSFAPASTRLRYDWIYLVLAITIALASQTRQRRAFYYAGVLNTGAALL